MASEAKQTSCMLFNSPVLMSLGDVDSSISFPPFHSHLQPVNVRLQEEIIRTIIKQIILGTLQESVINYVLKGQLCRA